jgi:hypothetical protein
MRRLCQSQSQMHVICIHEAGAPIDRQGRSVVSSSLHVNGADILVRAVRVILMFSLDD